MHKLVRKTGDVATQELRMVACEPGCRRDPISWYRHPDYLSQRNLESVSSGTSFTPGT